MAADTQEDLQDRIEHWNEILTSYGMRISKDKTETMIISRTTDDINISLDGQLLRQCRNFKYLGVTFGEENTSEIEIVQRINKFNNNLRLLYPLLKDRNIPRKVKVIIYTSILRPMLMFWT